MVPWSGFPFLRCYPGQEDFGSEYEQISLRKDYSCRVEPLFRLLHRLSSASCALRLFQLTPSHIEEALALVVSALVMLALIAVAFIVVQPYAVAWRSASVLLPSVLLLQEHTTRRAAGTIPTHRATKAFSESYRALVDRRAHHRGGAGVDCLAGYYEGAPGGSDRFQPATNDLRLGSKAPF
jgi:hypothetical protein